jgi:hypothetical protein
MRIVLTVATVAASVVGAAIAGAVGAAIALAAGSVVSVVIWGSLVAGIARSGRSIDHVSVQPAVRVE